MLALRRFLRPERGVASVEFITTLPILILAAAFAWQILLMASAVTAAENAARTGSRAATRGGNGAAAAMEALPPWLRDDARIGGGSLFSTRVSVSVQAPLLFPALNLPAVRMTRAAELPPPS